MKNKLQQKDKERQIRDHYTVVLEDIRSQVRGVVEGVVALNEKTDRIEKRLQDVESDLTYLRGEVAIIRHNQVTRDEFKLLESRVLILEKKSAR